MKTNLPFKSAGILIFLLFPASKKGNMKQIAWYDYMTPGS